MHGGPWHSGSHPEARGETKVLIFILYLFIQHIPPESNSSMGACSPFNLSMPSTDGGRERNKRMFQRWGLAKPSLFGLLNTARRCFPEYFWFHQLHKDLKGPMDESSQLYRVLNDTELLRTAQEHAIPRQNEKKR